jgi:Flp pilus assembly protein TadG
MFKNLKSFANRLTELFRDKSGVSMATVALMMPLLIGFSGLAMDVGVWQVNKRNLQGAADQAAFAAAIAASKGATTDQARMQAKAVMAEHGYLDGAEGLTLTISNPPTAGHFSGQSGYCEVLADCCDPRGCPAGPHDHHTGRYINNAR